MNYEMLTGPVVGTVVGYCTNYIAVKMLFRPLKPIMIGKFKLPFTPGIIPKGKKRLAKALGNMIGGTLVTEEDFKKILFSDELKEKIISSVNNYIEKNINDDKTVKDMCEKILGDNLDSLCKEFSDKITDKIMRSLGEVDIANVISSQIVDAIKEKVKGSFLQMMVNDSLLSSFKEPMEEKINNYIENDGKNIISDKVDLECKKLMDMKLSRIKKALDNRNIDLSNIVLNVYQQLLEDKFTSIIKFFDIKSIVEEKIIEMDVLELEKLIMSVMKKELNAIINLGALIGFILGLVTVFIK